MTLIFLTIFVIFQTKRIRKYEGQSFLGYYTSDGWEGDVEKGERENWKTEDDYVCFVLFFNDYQRSQNYWCNV